MPLKVILRGEHWHYSGTVAGRRLRGTTGTTEKARAQRIAAEIEAREWRRHLDGPGAHVTMAQAAIAYRQAEKSTRFLDKIENYWRDTLLREITAGAILRSALTIYPRASAATRNRQAIAPTQAIINHAATLEWCSPIKVKRFPIDPKPRLAVDLAWVNTFANQANADDLPHLAALCLFMFGTGARIGEAVGMCWDDVDLTARTATMRGRKPTPWTRTAHLPAPVHAAIANIPSNRNKGDPVFDYLSGQNVKKTWENVVSRAGIKRMTPHSCRHGFATTMLRAGYDVKTVAKMGGWRDAGIVLKHYAHAIEDNTVTDAVFGTDLTQRAKSKHLIIGNKTEK